MLYKKSKKHTNTESVYLAAVRVLSCAVCNRLGDCTPCEEIHHILECGRRIGHGVVLPLCREHHQGDNGIGGLGKRGFEARYKFTELDLLNDTILRIASGKIY